MKLKMRKQYTDKSLFLDTKVEDTSIPGITINFLKYTNIVIDNGDDITEYIGKGYYISKTKALMIEGVTDMKISFLTPANVIGNSKSYSLDDVIKISKMTFNEVKNKYLKLL